MSRSEAVRQEVLNRDGFRCQICGYDGLDTADRSLLHVHHVRPLGMGGSDELDVAENMITLCANCHNDIHSGAKTIARWGDGEFEVVDREGHRIDHRRLWYHRRKFAEELEAVEARVAGLHAIDGTVARDVYELWHDDAWQYLDPDARSWKEYAASRSWDVRRATRLAKKWAQGIELGIEWEPTETESEFSRKLPKAPREYFYLRLQPFGLHKWYRTAYPEELREVMEVGDVLVKVGATLWGIRADNGKLIGPDGNEVPVTEFKPEGA